MTLPEPVLAEACRNMAGLSAPNGAALVGINLEGPFVSPHKLGAQNPDYVMNPDAALFRRLQAAAGGLVKLLAIAPEVDGGLAVIRELSGEVVCSLAHTAADYGVAMDAFACEARHVTHLYNAMPPFSHREPGVIGAAFDTPACMVELITDNVHIHPSVVRATFRMFGDDRVILISDSMMATGLTDGLYELGGQPVRVEGKTARLERDGAIAGSVTNLMNCMRTAASEMGIPLYSAVKCASVNPAKSIGVFDRRGSITPGKYADLVLLDESLAVKQVFLRGRAIL
jgi:N-acetylglucosamine-6-phosphate deacetylase